jgi:YbbR domain-containing protein
MKLFFLDNLGLKIAAVLLSIVLWVFVTSRGQSEISLDVPIEVKNVPAGLEMVNYSVKTVTLTIKGQERFVRNLRPSETGITIDLSKAKKGENIYFIHRDDIKLPRSITVTSITPSSIKVLTEESITRPVKVVPPVIGEPEKGYYVRSFEVSPQTVEIEGVRSEVLRLKNVKTEPLDVTGLSETFSQDVKIDLTGRNVRSKVSDVTVKVVIGGKGK